MFMLCFISMFPLSYRHPKGKVNLNYVFIKPQSPSSVCDRKETGDDQIKLKQVPEGWRCVIVQVVRWWRCCAVWSFFLEFFLILLLLLLFFFFFWWPCVVFFSTWKLFPLFAVERCSLSFQALFHCYQQFLFLFLLQHKHCLPVIFFSAFPLHSFLPSLPNCDLFEQMVCIQIISGLP